MSNTTSASGAATTETNDTTASGTRRRPGFLHHAAVYGVGAVSIQLVSIVLLPVYTNYMSPADFGVLQLLYRTGDFLNICLMVGGIQLAAQNFWGKADTDEERKHVAATVGWLTAVALLISLPVILCFSRQVADFLGIEDARLLAFGIFTMMLRAITVMPLALMQARLESTVYLVSSLAMAITQLVLVSAALMVFQGGVWGTVTALALTYAVFGIVLTCMEFTKSTPVPDLSLMKSMIKFSLPFIPSGLCFFVLHNGDQFFLIKYWGAATLGVYALGYRIAKGVMMFAVEPLAQVWRAKMYEVHKLEDNSIVFGKVYTRILFAFTAASVGVVLFQKEALQLLGADEYQNASAVIPALLLAHFFYIASVLLDGALYVTRRTDIKPKIAFVSTIIMTAAYALLIPRWGAVGAAHATTIGFLSLAGLTMYFAQKTFTVRLEFTRLIPMMAIAIATALMGMICETIVIKLFLFAGMFIGVWMCGLVDSEEKNTVYRFLRKLPAMH